MPTPQSFFASKQIKTCFYVTLAIVIALIGTKSKAADAPKAKAQTWSITVAPKQNGAQNTTVTTFVLDEKSGAVLSTETSAAREEEEIVTSVEVVPWGQEHVAQNDALTFPPAPAPMTPTSPTLPSPITAPPMDDTEAPATENNAATRTGEITVTANHFPDYDAPAVAPKTDSSMIMDTPVDASSAPCCDQKHRKINPADYVKVYNSIPFRRSEYDANPGYRHQSTMEILLGQPKPVTIHKHEDPAPVSYNNTSPYFGPYYYPMNYGLGVYGSRYYQYRGFSYGGYRGYFGNGFNPSPNFGPSIGYPGYTNGGFRYFY
jgi:hypothetical protein